MRSYFNYSIIDTFINNYCEEHKTHPEDIEVRSFPQVWGSTALGFGGMGGATMTAAQTTVLWSHYRDIAWVAFSGQVAYKIINPNQLFFEDVRNGSMKERSQAGLYKCKDDSK